MGRGKDKGRDKKQNKKNWDEGEKRRRGVGSEVSVEGRRYREKGNKGKAKERKWREEKLRDCGKRVG